MNGRDKFRGMGREDENQEILMGHRISRGWGVERKPPGNIYSWAVRVLKRVPPMVGGDDFQNNTFPRYISIA